MFKGVFNSLVNFSISVIQDKELSDMARQNALELMATFADFAPGMCRKDPQYTSEMVTQCLSLMTDVGEEDDDAQQWLLQDDVSFNLAFKIELHLMRPRLKQTTLITTMLPENSV
jgi:importin-5